MENREALESQKGQLMTDKGMLETQLADTKRALQEAIDKAAAAEQATHAAQVRQTLACSSIRILIPLTLDIQMVNTRTVEAYNSKLEGKKLEFMKLKEELALLKSTNADLSDNLTAAKVAASTVEAELTGQLHVAKARTVSLESIVATLEDKCIRLQTSLDAAVSAPVPCLLCFHNHHHHDV